MGTWWTCASERAAVVLLEKAFLPAPLRAADQADRPLRGPWQHQRGDRRVVIGQLALGLAAFGKDHPVAAGHLDCFGLFGGFIKRFIRTFGHHFGGLLVVAQAQEAAVAHVAVGGELGKGDLRNELRGEPGNPARRHPVDLGRRGLALDPGELLGQVGHRVLREAGADITLVDQLLALVLREQERREGAPLGGRFLPPDDDEFLPPGALDLDPAFRPA